MKLILSQKLAKLIKAVILIGLVVTFALFIQEVWIKFTEQATNYRQSFKQVDSYETPIITICFSPTKKPSMKQHYNLDGMDWTNLVNNNISIKSMSKMFYDSYYHLGRDFTLTLLSQKMDKQTEIHEEAENFYEYPDGSMNKIHVGKFHSYMSGLCYSLNLMLLQIPDQFFSFGLVLNDSLKSNNDEPKKVEVIFTSKSNTYGVVRGTWVEGDQLEISLPLKEKGSVMANLREYWYHLLSSPPHCEQISHYECLGHGLLKDLEEGKFCISTHLGNLCINTCPKLCLPLVFQSLIEHVTLNITIPLCETGEENKCMATIMHWHLVELSKNCSSGCTILKYKGADSV